MELTGTVEGFVHHHLNQPTFRQQPCDYTIKVRVTENVEALLDKFQDDYDNGITWYRNNSGQGGTATFNPPWITHEDGSITVRLCAKPQYKEHPFPVMDSELKPLDKEIEMREGSEVNVHFETKVFSPKTIKGGIRFKPTAMQVTKLVTYQGTDSGTKDTPFKKVKGFSQSKPAVQPVETKAEDVDIDF